MINPFWTKFLDIGMIVTMGITIPIGFGNWSHMDKNISNYAHNSNQIFDFCMVAVTLGFAPNVIQALRNCRNVLYLLKIKSCEDGFIISMLTY